MLLRLRLELCKLLILGGSNYDVQLDQLAVTDRWVEGLAIKPIQVEYVMTQFPKFWDSVVIKTTCVIRQA